MRRILSVLLLLCIVLIQGIPIIVHAAENSSLSETVEAFVDYVANNEQSFHSWNSLSVSKAYDLYDITGVIKRAELYYIRNPGCGYVIISTDGTILEFANGLPAYDKFCGTYTKAMYDKGGYFLDVSGAIVRLYSDGSVVKTSDSQSRTILDMTANLQGSYWCIPTAIANIMWYWNAHGFPGLADGSFSGVQEEITGIMGSSVTSNSGIASAVAVYTSSKMRTGSARSISATYASIVSEINAGRPCLLGFANGGGYSSAHMTACCGYYTTSYGDFAVVVDGHSSSRVYRTWGTYNDYVGQIKIS